MRREIINYELAVEFPEDFHILDGDELVEAYTDDYPSRWAAKSPSGEVMIAVFWHQSNVMLTALADSRYMISGMESRIKKTLKDHGYKRDAFFHGNMAGHKARGFRYEYTLNGALQDGEVVMFKHGSRIYTLYYYAARKEEKWLVEGPAGPAADEDSVSESGETADLLTGRQIWKSFLKSLEFVEEED